MHYVYLIRSDSHPKQTYVGYSTDLRKRLRYHNQGDSPHTAKILTSAHVDTTVPPMRQIKALIYGLLGGMVAWGYWQRGSVNMTIFIALFTLAMIALTLSTIGRMRISWNQEGITLAAFPKKPQLIRWDELENIKLDHLGYHISASNSRFKIRQKSMPENLLKRIKENIRNNQAKRSS